METDNQNDPTDITVRCCLCRESFEWPVHEQRYFALNGWTKPRRCRECRRLQREARAAGLGRGPQPDRR